MATTKLSLKAKGNLIIIDISDVISFEKENNYIKINFKNSQGVYIRTTMKKLQETLKEKNLYGIHFLKSHCSFIVNIKHIKELNSRQILMSNKDKIPISNSYRKSFLCSVRENLTSIS